MSFASIVNLLFGKARDAWLEAKQIAVTTTSQSISFVRYMWAAISLRRLRKSAAASPENLRECEDRVRLAASQIASHNARDWIRCGIGYLIVVCLLIFVSRGSTDQIPRATAAAVADPTVNVSSVSSESPQQSPATATDSGETRWLNPNDFRQEKDGRVLAVPTELDRPARPAATNGPIVWQSIRDTFGANGVEEGKRDDFRFLLLNGCLMVLEDQDCLHVFASPLPEGLQSLDNFLSSQVFAISETRLIRDAIDSNARGPRRLGRFNVSIGATEDNVMELPRRWIRIDIAAGNKSLPETQSRIPYSGAYSWNELFSISRHRRANVLIRDVLRPTKSDEDIEASVRAFGILADAAGFEADRAHQLLINALAEARRIGVEPQFAVEAASKSLAIRMAESKQELDRVLPR